MAEENISEAQRQLSEAMAAVQRDLAQYGQITRQTAEQRQDAEAKAKYGINNFTAGTTSAANALTSLAGAGFSAGKAMLEGKKGAAAFNSSLDELSTAATAAGAALALMIPGGILIKGLVAGLTMATTAAIKYAQAANEMGDKLHNAYRGLAQSGAAASDGMTGIKEGAQKLGLSMDELNDYVQLVAENSRDLANFGGTVYKGRQAFENLGKAMEPAQKGLLNMGLMPKDIAEGMAGYLRTQTRLGSAQRMTTEQLAEGARKYLVEQDALTKLTGVQRKEAEKMREDALMEEQHAGMVRKLQLEGRPEEAKNMIAVSDAANRLSPELGKMVRALQTNNLSSEQARKLMISAPGAMRALEMGTKGVLKPMEVMDTIIKELATTGDTLGVGLAPLGAFNQVFVDMGEIQKLRIAQEKGLQKTLDETQAEMERQGATGKKAADQLVENQSNLIQAQIAANKAMTNFVFAGIGPAQEKMIELAKAAGLAADGLNKMFHNKVEKTETSKRLDAAQTKREEAFKDAGFFTKMGFGLNKEQQSANQEVLEAYAANQEDIKRRGREQIWNFIKGMFGGQKEEEDIPKGADGGLFSGPTSGYLAMLHGTELVVPEDKLQGQIKTGGMAGAGGEQLDKMNDLYNEILKDTQSLEKITDLDLKKTKDFSRLSDRLRTLKTQLMNEEIELLEAQRSVGGGPGGGGPGGGLSMPGGGMNMPGMGGGQGLKGPEEHQAVGQGGQGIKGPPKLATIRSKSGKSTSVNAEYAPRFQSLIDYLDGIGYEISSLGGYVDRDVRGKPGVKSVHAHGGAIDINPGSNPMGGQLITDMPENIGAIAKQLGLGWGGNWNSIKDAMHFSVAANEGGDIKLSDGGVAVGPNAGYPATLHGQEAVIPLNNAGGNFVKMFEDIASSNRQIANMMDELVRAQKNGNDISSKMLRMQA